MEIIQDKDKLKFTLILVRNDPSSFDFSFPYVFKIMVVQIFKLIMQGIWRKLTTQTCLKIVLGKNNAVTCTKCVRRKFKSLLSCTSFEGQTLHLLGKTILVFKPWAISVLFAYNSVVICALSFLTCWFLNKNKTSPQLRSNWWTLLILWLQRATKVVETQK